MMDEKSKRSHDPIPPWQWLLLLATLSLLGCSTPAPQFRENGLTQYQAPDPIFALVSSHTARVEKIGECKLIETLPMKATLVPASPKLAE